jgi:hypothetical protein
MYLVAGSMTVYDGSKEYKLKPGDYGIGGRNHLARFTKQAKEGKCDLGYPDGERKGLESAFE